MDKFKRPKKNSTDTEMASPGPDTEYIEDIKEEEEEPIPYDYDIYSYGADYPVYGLVNGLNTGDIVVPTFGQHSSTGSDFVGFQRQYVWSRLKADRFIESLLLGLPVPGIFLVQDKLNRFLVLDGQQRLRTLRAFYDGKRNNRDYRLEKVHPSFRDKSYADLDVEDRRKLDNSIIHATVVRQQQPTNDQSSIYMIFERLNTGGLNLQPQEIRVALYHGKLAQVLLQLNENSAWRYLYGNRSGRLKDLEMILRFLAFYYLGDEYAMPMKNFLNRYMGTNRDLRCQSKAQLQGVFDATTTLLKDAVGKEAFRPRGALNAAALDSVMAGVAKRLEQGPVNDHAKLKQQHRLLFSNRDYIEAIKTGTSKEAKVRTRMRLAREAFAEVE